MIKEITVTSYPHLCLKSHENILFKIVYIDNYTSNPNLMETPNLGMIADTLFASSVSISK